jgi:hypothetical protein
MGSAPAVHKDQALTAESVVQEGRAVLVRGPREFLREQGTLAKDPQEWMEDSENLLIKLKPEKIKSWGLEQE